VSERPRYSSQLDEGLPYGRRGIYQDIVEEYGFLKPDPCEGSCNSDSEATAVERNRVVWFVNTLNEMAQTIVLLLANPSLLQQCERNALLKYRELMRQTDQLTYSIEYVLSEVIGRE
jgi:hypothetical protein